MRTTKQLLFFLLIILWSGFAPAQDIPEGSEEQPARGIVYTTVISGEMESRIRQSLYHISDTKSLEDRPPMTVNQLHRRARADVREFTDAFRSFGFYSPEIEYTLDEKSTPVMVEFQIDPGPAYLIREVSIINICPEMTPLPDLPGPEELNLEPGSRILSQKVLDARQVIAKHVRDRGYPFPFVSIEEVIIDHREHSASIDLGLDPGPAAEFGQTSVSGLDRVRDKYIFDRLPWEKGDPFKASLMDAFRRQLTAGGLFTIVEVTHPGELEDDDTQLPVNVRVLERKPRTVRAGLSYLSDIGPELKVGWVHRNLRGMGEVLEFDLVASEVLTSIKGGYTMPGWLRTDQNLSFRSGMVLENTDAYDSESLYARTSLERMLTSKLTAGVGAGYRIARVKQFGETDDLMLAFFPTSLTFDGRDDILDPGTGIRVNLQVTPFFDTLNPENRFIKTYSSVNTYLELMSEKRIVLANRVVVGTINAEKRSNVPPDERYYAGGGGSIRGFSYQKAGELEDDKPVGGLSLAEINSEIRLKMTRRSGLVAFLDGGRAFKSWYPDFDEEIFWGWGFGYRFYSDFGPIRADVAFPVNRRKGVDDSFQVYISLGQSF
jgi:translocation and assembly module TamA